MLPPEEQPIPPPVNTVSGPLPPPPEERAPVVKSYGKGVMEKFGTQTEKGRIVVCFRNGDKHQSAGVRMYSIMRSMFENI